MKKHLVFPLFALLLMSGCVSQATYDLKVKEANTLTAKSDELQTQIKTLTAELEGLKKEQAALRGEKAALEHEKESTLKDTEALQAQVSQLTKKAEKAEQLEKATQTYQDLQKKLEKEIQEGQVQIREMKDRLTVTMVDQILFASGSAEVGKKGKAVLAKVVTILKDVKGKRIEVDGHTDNVPIINTLRSRFATNWELSTARATEVVRYLQDEGGIDPRVLSATGFGEYQPVASNDTEEGRHKNRRIEIVLLPSLK
jgi:chemotaxis protein MotB